MEFEKKTPTLAVIAEKEVEDALASIPPGMGNIVDVFDVTKALPTAEERTNYPKGVYAMAVASSRAAYIRTKISLVLDHLMNKYRASKAKVTIDGHIAFYSNSKRRVAILSVMMVRKYLYPLLCATVKELKGMSPDQFKKFTDKQTSIQDISFVATSLYAVAKQFSTDMAYAFKVGSFANLKDAVWSLMYEESLTGTINGEVEFNHSNGEIRGFAFGKRMVTEFALPRSIRSQVSATELASESHEVWNVQVNLDSFTAPARHQNTPATKNIEKKKEMKIGTSEAARLTQKSHQLALGGEKLPSPPPQYIASSKKGPEEELTPQESSPTITLEFDE